MLAPWYIGKNTVMCTGKRELGKTKYLKQPMVRA